MNYISTISKILLISWQWPLKADEKLQSSVQWRSKEELKPDRHLKIWIAFCFHCCHHSTLIFLEKGEWGQIWEYVDANMTNQWNKEFESGGMYPTKLRIFVLLPQSSADMSTDAFSWILFVWDQNVSYFKFNSSTYIWFATKFFVKIRSFKT